MEVFKKHGFWILLGAILLGEAIWLHFGVVSKGQTMDRLLNSIRSYQDSLERFRAMDEEIPRENLKEYYEKLRKDYEMEKEKIEDFYLSLDREIEPGGLPSLSEYRASYTDRMNSLVGEVQEKLGGEGEQRPDAGLQREGKIDDENMVLVEKRYQFQKNLTEVAIRAGVSRLEKIRFDAPTAETKGPLPHEVHTIKMTVECPPPAVPVLVSEVLQSSIPYRLKGLTIGKLTLMGEQVFPEDSRYRWENAEVLSVKFDDEEAYQKITDDEILPEPPLEVVLVVDVIDVMQDRVQKEDEKE